MAEKVYIKHDGKPLREDIKAAFDRAAADFKLAHPEVDVEDIIEFMRIVCTIMANFMTEEYEPGVH